MNSNEERIRVFQYSSVAIAGLPQIAKGLAG